MTQLFSNNSVSTLATSIGASDTSFYLAVGTGSLFPSPSGGDYFLVTLEYNNQIEICKVGSRTGDTLSNISRAQEGTSAQVFPAVTLIEVRLTAGTLTSMSYEAIHYRGDLDLTTGFPTASIGDMYRISVGNTISSIVYRAGDMAVYSGTIWTKIDNNNLVTSVAGRTGDVVVSKTDVGLSNVVNGLQLQAANNLSDLTNIPVAQTNLGVDPAGTATAMAIALGG